MKSKTVYACTFVEKRAEIDDFEKGCLPHTSVCTIAEPCHVASDSLPGLLKALGDLYGLEIDDVFVPDEDGELDRIGFNQLETADGFAPTKNEIARWKRGSLTLYLADYDFIIEKRIVEPLSFNEFKQAGIKVH